MRTPSSPLKGRKGRLCNHKLAEKARLDGMERIQAARAKFGALIAPGEYPQ